MFLCQSTFVLLERNMNGIEMLALQFITILMVIQISANNSTHGTFDYARTYCSQHGGMAYIDIVTTSLLTDYKVNDCSLANSSGLNDGESLWIPRLADLGTYITEDGCATALPQDSTLNLTGKPSLFQCTKECLARGSMNYISFHNGQCYCMADDHSDLECLDLGHAAVYRKFQFDVKERKHRCIVAKLNNRQFGYTSAKCSDKHSGVCVDRSAQSTLQSSCIRYHATFSEIGHHFCAPPGLFMKNELKGKCLKYNGKLPPHLYQGISHYLENGLYFVDSFLTFDPQTPGEYSVSEDFLACLSITKQGCMLILETDECDNVNRYQCDAETQSQQRGATTRMDSKYILVFICLFFIKTT
ncbi:uncharacterized protein LOC128238837 [Mya arenaria]|uniref:uncharacterized protein LOC128238837 n=1 Tax=Mya arenaria TaxID=6604 RepID=UPI0022E62E98|nr:uncharacterized protein LOC128238837 [Mya arenaria]